MSDNTKITWVEMNLGELRKLANAELPDVHDQVRTAVLQFTDFHWNAYESFAGDRFEAAGEKFTKIMTKIDKLLWHTILSTDKTTDGVLQLVRNYIDAELANADHVAAASNRATSNGSSVPGYEDGGS